MDSEYQSALKIQKKFDIWLSYVTNPAKGTNLTSRHPSEFVNVKDRLILNKHFDNQLSAYQVGMLTLTTQPLRFYYRLNTMSATVERLKTLADLVSKFHAVVDTCMVAFIVEDMFQLLPGQVGEELLQLTDAQLGALPASLFRDSGLDLEIIFSSV